MKGKWPDDVVLQLENWSVWIDGGKQAVSSISPFPAYKLAARGKRAGNVIPIFTIEAEKADRIIESMVERYKNPLKLHYRWNQSTRTQESKARSCNCCVETYLLRLNEAHHLFEALWHGRRPVAFDREFG